MRPATLAFTRLVFTRLIFIGAIATSLASPAIAKGSHADANTQKVGEQPASQGCHAYQKGPDDSWIEMACHEGSESASTPVHSKSAQTR